MTSLHVRHGDTTSPPWTLSVDPARAGWVYSSLRVVDLRPGETVQLDTGHQEILVLPLSGSCSVQTPTFAGDLVGRGSVFDGPSDFVYIGVETSVTLHSTAGGRFAIPGSVANTPRPVRYYPASDSAVNIRGAGQCTRRITDVFMSPTNDAEHLLVCEGVVPAGNWASYPPHKHDEEGPGQSNLEEIYYFDFQGHGAPAFGFQRIYGTPDRPVDVMAEVRSGDVVFVPHGWHGPTIAAPDFDLYFLNVMAGPGERVWRACDDPTFAWVRSTWATQEPDPRAHSLSALKEIDQ